MQINQIIGIAGSEIDESGFIFHNTADENIASRDFLPQIGWFTYLEMFQMDPVLKREVKR